MPQLLTDGVDLKQLNQLISSSSSSLVGVKKINEKIIAYLIVKLCYTGMSNFSHVGLEIVKFVMMGVNYRNIE